MGCTLGWKRRSLVATIPALMASEMLLPLALGYAGKLESFPIFTECVCVCVWEWGGVEMLGR